MIKNTILDNYQSVSQEVIENLEAYINGKPIRFIK